MARKCLEGSLGRTLAARGGVRWSAREAGEGSEAQDSQSRLHRGLHGLDLERPRLRSKEESRISEGHARGQGPGQVRTNDCELVDIDRRWQRGARRGRPCRSRSQALERHRTKERADLRMAGRSSTGLLTPRVACSRSDDRLAAWSSCRTWARRAAWLRDRAEGGRSAASPVGIAEASSRLELSSKKSKRGRRVTHMGRRKETRGSHGKRASVGAEGRKEASGGGGVAEGWVLNGKKRARKEGSCTNGKRRPETRGNHRAKWGRKGKGRGLRKEGGSLRDVMKGRGEE